MILIRSIRDNTLFWFVEPYKTLEFWAVYGLWAAAVLALVRAVINQPRMLSPAAKVMFVAVLLGPMAGLVGLLRSHARIRRALSQSHRFLGTPEGKEVISQMSAIRFQMLFMVVTLEAFAILLI